MAILAEWSDIMRTNNCPQHRGHNCSLLFKNEIMCGLQLFQRKSFSPSFHQFEQNSKYCHTYAWDWKKNQFKRWVSSVKPAPKKQIPLLQSRMVMLFVLGILMEKYSFNFGIMVEKIEGHIMHDCPTKMSFDNTTTQQLSALQLWLQSWSS